MITNMLMFIGTTELLLIGGIALLLFGGKKLPEMMKGLGQGVQSFKKGMNEPLKEDSENGAEDDNSGTVKSSDSEEKDVDSKTALKERDIER